MSVVSLLGVKVLNNPANFSDPYEFEITFECLEQLQKDLEWKLTYVGSATSSEHDQELDSLLVGPIPIGVNKFIFEADPPDLKKIPSSEILGVTVILLTCAYDDREFVRVGYYVNNEYDSEELNAEPPARPVIERVRRNVLAEKPRVTRFAIKWDSEESAPAEYPPDQPEADTLDDDGTAYGAEEAEMQAALEKELAEAEKQAREEGDKKVQLAQPQAIGGDAEMAGTDDAATSTTTVTAAPATATNGKGKAGEDEDEEEGDGEGEGEGDEDIEMGEDSDAKGASSSNTKDQKPNRGVNGNPSAEVMVH